MARGSRTRRIEAVSHVESWRQRPFTGLVHQESDVLHMVVLIARHAVEHHAPEQLLERLHRQLELPVDYLPYCKTVRIPEPHPKTPLSRDAFDVLFMQLAIVGKAKVLITGDQDLLSIVDNFVRPIVTVEQFFESISS
jgi:putative PIN family toxin of toxin-antitoxin system